MLARTNWMPYPQMLSQSVMLMSTYNYMQTAYIPFSVISIISTSLQVNSTWDVFPCNALWYMVSSILYNVSNKQC